MLSPGGDEYFVVRDEVVIVDQSRRIVATSDEAPLGFSARCAGRAHWLRPASQTVGQSSMARRCSFKLGSLGSCTATGGFCNGPGCMPYTS